MCIALTLFTTLIVQPKLVLGPGEGIIINPECPLAIPIANFPNV